MLGRVDGGFSSRWQPWLLPGVLFLGLVGTLVELVLLEHYEDPWQLVPLALIPLAVVAVGWYLRSPTFVSRSVLQVTMTSFVAAGLIGVVLHMRGAAEFQLDIDPTMDRWTLLVKTLRAKAPPALAPGLMIQLGLIGFILTLTKESDHGR